MGLLDNEHGSTSPSGAKVLHLVHKAADPKNSEQSVISLLDDLRKQVETERILKMVVCYIAEPDPAVEEYYCQAAGCNTLEIVGLLSSSKADVIARARDEAAQ